MKNSCNATEATKHQLFDAENSNIPNKNVLNTAKATAASNIPSKISGEMFFPTTFLQYVKDKYENLVNSSCRKDTAANICGTCTVIPWSETIDSSMVKFCGHVFHMIWKSYLNLYAGEGVKIKPGHLVVVTYTKH